MDRILEGKKRHEYKVESPFWKKRLEPLLDCDERINVNFLCGQLSYKFKVKYVKHHNMKGVIDGIKCDSFYVIGLHYEISPCCYAPASKYKTKLTPPQCLKCGKYLEAPHPIISTGNNELS